MVRPLSLLDGVASYTPRTDAFTPQVAAEGYQGPPAGAVSPGYPLPPTGTLIDLAEAQRLIAKHRPLHDTVERARVYGDAALAALECFPDGAERRALADIVEFCIARAR